MGADTPTAAIASKPAATPRRPFYRLHASTWFLLLPVLALLILLMAPGLVTSFKLSDLAEAPTDSSVRSEHGWPWRYLRRELISGASLESAYESASFTGTGVVFAPGTPYTPLLEAIANDELTDERPDWTHGYAWWGPDESHEWQGRWLAADLAVALAILLSFAAVLEWRRRRHARAWQFSIGEAACGVALIAGGLAWWRTNFAAPRAQIGILSSRHAQIRLSDDRGPIPVTLIEAEGQYASPEWLRRLSGIQYAQAAARTTSIEMRRWTSADPPEELSEFRSLKSIKLHRLDDAPSFINWMATRPRLTEIDVCPVTHDAIAALCRTGRLTGLDLGDYLAVAVCDADLEFLIHSPKLRKLDLSYSQVTDDGLRRVASLQELEELNLERTRITDAGLARLSSLKTLKRLKLAQSRVTDEGLRAVSNLTSLTKLDLEDSRLVTNDGMLFLSWLPNLESLNVKDTAVTDAGVERLVQIKTLTELRLRSDQIAPITRRKLQGSWSGQLIVQ